MLAAREPLSRQEIAAATGLDGTAELPRTLARLAAFLPPREQRYAVFHKSLSDWLTGWDKELDQPIAGPVYHLSPPRGERKITEWCWAEYQRGVRQVSPYTLRHLPAHLGECGRPDDLRRVLLDFEWLRGKLHASDVNALLDDFRYAFNDEVIRLLQSAIRLSAHVLVRDERQLRSQLTGRLLGHDAAEIGTLLEQARTTTSEPWLRPLTASLIAAGGLLLRTLTSTGRVSAVAVCADGKRALSTSADRTVRVWDLKVGDCIAAFEADSSVTSCTVAADSGLFVAGDGSGRVHFLRLES